MGGSVESFARELKSYIRDRWLTLMRVAPSVFAHNTSSMAAREMLTLCLEEAPGAACRTARSMAKLNFSCPVAPVKFNSWVNVFHGDGELFTDQFHDHQWHWHGFLVLP